MIDTTEATALAQRYLSAVENKEHHESFATDSSDTSIEAAYAVQDVYQKLLGSQGHELVGYKVALTSQAMQEFVGVDQPLAGGVFGHVVVDSPATVSLSDYRHLGVEFEVAVRVGADLTPDDGPHTRQSVEDAVSACHPAFELVEDRHADYSVLDPFDLVAENAWNAGVVLAEPGGDWRTLDLVDASTRLETNGEPIGEGKTGDALGHPMEALAWLANQINSRGHTLRAGQFVMTGSSIVTQFPEPGDELVFTIEGLGEATLNCR